MDILTIILKSGIKMDLTDAEKIEAVSREIINIEYRGMRTSGEIEWQPIHSKKINNYLRITKEGKFWEINEDEIAGFQHLAPEETHESSEKMDIKI